MSNEHACMHRGLRLCVIGLFALALMGCGPTVHPVEGDVQVDGKPLAKGAVIFWPDTAKGNTYTGRPTGEVEAGRYKLMTEGRIGAPQGWYKVTITAYESEPDIEKPTEVKSAVDKKYSEAATTPITIEVVSTGGQYTLKATKE